jgi:hypothetical protein
MQPDEFRYEVDATDRIRRVDAAWGRVARANGAAAADPARVVGRSIFDFIAGGEVRHLYGLLFRSARTRRRPIRLPFRCDAPDRRRFMELRIEPGAAGALRIATSLLFEEPRPVVRLLDAATPRSDELVALCSWCKRVRTAPGVWQEIEDAVRALGLFDEASMPGLTHGICAPCEDALSDAIEGEGPPAARAPGPRPPGSARA